MKKLLLLATVMLVCLMSFVGFGFAENNFIDLNSAKKVAFNHIVSDMIANECANWREGIHFSNITTLYDLEQNPSAYLFELKDGEGNPNGYIVISADKESVPVIEFGYEGQPFIYNAYTEVEKKIKQEKIKVKEHKKLYYLGGINYFVEYETEHNKKILFDITTSNFKKVIKDNLSYINGKDRKYIAQWDSLLNGNNSNPPTSGDSPITNPYDYENNYSSVNYDNVTGYYHYYCTTGDFSGYSNHCGPTAGINIVKYWWYRDSKYSALYDSTNGWTDEFDEMHDLMNCDPESGTYIGNVDNALETYFSNRNLSCNASNNYLPTTGTVTTDISADRPFLLCLQGHYLYGNHFVLGLGYYQFVYDWAADSWYIRIADGWTHYPGRYVHWNAGVTAILMTRLTVY